MAPAIVTAVLLRAFVGVMITSGGTKMGMFEPLTRPWFFLSYLAVIPIVLGFVATSKSMANNSWIICLWLTLWLLSLVADLFLFRTFEDGAWAMGATLGFLPYGFLAFACSFGSAWVLNYFDFKNKPLRR